MEYNADLRLLPQNPPYLGRTNCHTGAPSARDSHKFPRISPCEASSRHSSRAGSFGSFTRLLQNQGSLGGCAPVHALPPSELNRIIGTVCDEQSTNNTKEPGRICQRLANCCTRLYRRTKVWAGRACSLAIRAPPPGMASMAMRGGHPSFQVQTQRDPLAVPGTR